LEVLVATDKEQKQQRLTTNTCNLQSLLWLLYLPKCEMCQIQYFHIQAHIYTRCHTSCSHHIKSCRHCCKWQNVYVELSQSQ